MIEQYQPHQSYIRVATACPEVTISDTRTNTAQISELYNQASEADVSLLVFPELSITGYTIGDLVNQNTLLEQAKESVIELAKQTADKNTAMIVGFPLQVQNGLYNCAALLADGQIKGIVPKQNHPSYGEFYDSRWFKTWDRDIISLSVGEDTVPFGNDVLFEVGGVPVGIEICEDLWVSTPPSNKLAEQGALLIANPSASPEQIGKDDYRRMLVAGQSGRLVAGYIYAGCDTSESTMDIVMGGHQLITANGKILAEREPFADRNGTKLTISDIDIEHLLLDRRRQKFANLAGEFLVKTDITRVQSDLLLHIDKNPFLPDESPEKRKERLDKVFKIMAHGLAMRMRNTKQEKLVLGLSGGRDSTLALLVAADAAKILGKDPGEMIHTITMPGPASSDRTQTNAQQLAATLGVKNKVIPIHGMVTAELAALDHEDAGQDVTYENIQARARQALLFNYGNKHRCMVLGTGDLTEIILGWCTYGADQTSHYHVNGGLPKTVVTPLMEHMAPRFGVEKEVGIVAQDEASPELVQEIKGVITQKTEEKIGPYELHDFYMGNVIRWGDRPAKVAYLAKHAFQEKYDRETIEKWLTVHYIMFFKSQFKRTGSPDAPKIGPVSASKTGDLRQPTEIPVTPEQNIWLAELLAS